MTTELEYLRRENIRLTLLLAQRNQQLLNLTVLSGDQTDITTSPQQRSLE